MGDAAEAVRRLGAPPRAGDTVTDPDGNTFILVTGLDKTGLVLLGATNKPRTYQGSYHVYADLIEGGWTLRRRSR